MGWALIMLDSVLYMAIFAQLLMTSLITHCELTVDDGMFIVLIMCTIVDIVVDRAKLTVDDGNIAVATLTSVLRSVAIGTNASLILPDMCTILIFVSLATGLPSHYTKNPQRLVFALIVFAMLYM
jgi:hypothetical protein